MKKKSLFDLTANEFEVMQTLWDAGTALSKAEIVENSENKSWKASSIYILINALLKKGALVEDGFFRSQTNVGRKFKPAMTQKEYAVCCVSRDCEMNKISIVEVMEALVNKGMKKETLEQLKEIIDGKLK